MNGINHDALRFDHLPATSWRIVSPISWAMLGVIAVLAAGVIATAAYLPAAMQSATIEAAFRSNLEVADLVKIARGYYTQNVVAKVEHSGVLTPSYLHKGDPHAIPLPTTFVKDFSDLLKDKATSLSLVSPYPWPHRADRKMDDFETAAWNAFQQEPDAVFSRQEVKEGQRVLRVAVADHMTATACTSCHNEDPMSPKRDWKVGDVRAVMQVTRIVEPYLAAAEQSSSRISAKLAVAALVLSSALLIVIVFVERRAREQRQVDLRLDYLAHHDMLTGLPNRVFLRQRLRRVLEDREKNPTLSVLFVDLDGFKRVNDAFGHATGDALLKAVAKRLRSCVKEGDMVARWGGDEFVVLISADERSDPADTAVRIIDSLCTPFDLDGYQASIGASVGIAASTKNTTSADELLKHADLAVYRAKAEGRGVYRVFTPELDTLTSERCNLEQDLRQALDSGELEVHYQPIVDIETRQRVAMEALVRWRHPMQGLIAPDKFIPLAEETGLIDQLGECVLRQACVDAVRWPSSIRVAVNLSPVQFQNPDLSILIARILMETGLPAQRLEVEITESVLLHRSEKNIATLHRIRDLGISVALDDFGTGYSSMTYLRTFPFDKIKIDRSFVGEIAQLNSCAAIVCSVANLGRSLGVVTTAEGVETEEQLELLRAAGCTQAQGYLFGRPCPAAKLNFNAEIPRSAARRAETALTAQDIMLVRSSFARVVPIQAAVANLFYDRLFELAPHLRPLFPGDLSRQKLKLMNVLGACVRELHDFSNLAASVRDLGARHAGYGTKPEHYTIVAEALLWSLDQNLGDALTPEITAAWVKAYNLLAATMQAGADDMSPTMPHSASRSEIPRTSAA